MVQGALSGQRAFGVVQPSGVVPVGVEDAALQRAGAFDAALRDDGRQAPGSGDVDLNLFDREIGQVRRLDAGRGGGLGMDRCRKESGAGSEDRGAEEVATRYHCCSHRILFWRSVRMTALPVGANSVYTRPAVGKRQLWK